jgi:predicted ATP-grasp superfamily ATP-dependent carboligase
MAELHEIVEWPDTSLVARFDTETLLDFRARRPVMHLVEGVVEHMTWPTIELRHGRDLDGRHILLLSGAEPDVQWQTFTEEVADLAHQLGARMAIALGAYPNPVPHTRPGRVSASGASADLVERVQSSTRATVDVAAGLNAVIGHRCHQLEIPHVTLWAQVPNYVSGMAYPAGGVALLEQLEALTGLRVDLTPLVAAAASVRDNLDRLVASNPEHMAMVRQLEEHYDAQQTAEPQSMPSGDDLAAEVERYLREVGRGDA